MSRLYEILEHNRRFVASRAYEAYRTTKIPEKKMVVLTCMDTRLIELLPVIAAAVADAAAAKGDTHTFATIVHGAGIEGLDVQTAAQSLAEGTLLGSYRYDKYKSKNDDDNVDRADEQKRLLVFESDETKVAALEAGMARGTVLAEVTKLARDIVNAPGNESTPTVLAERAKAMADKVGLECEILDKAEMERLGMGSLLGVAQGSAQEPKLVFIRYKGSDDEQPRRLGRQRRHL